MLGKFGEYQDNITREESMYMKMVEKNLEVAGAQATGFSIETTFDVAKKKVIKCFKGTLMKRN